MLTTDYGKASDFENRQREHTFRGILSWDHNRSNWRTGVKGGYVHTWMGYDYKREVAPDNWAVMTRSRSKVNTIYGQIDGEYNPARRWYFTANVSAHQHFVRSEDKNIILQEGGNGIVGYDKGRIELSGAFSAKWQATDRIGMSLVLREEMFGEKWAPLTPAFFIDGLVARRGNVMLRASVSRNHKFPTLNDMYFLPGGNPDLRSEEGWTYDAGMSFDIGGESLESGSRRSHWEEVSHGLILISTLDNMVADNKGLFLSQKCEEGACLWYRGQRQYGIASRKRMADRSEWIIFLDSVD